MYAVCIRRSYVPSYGYDERCNKSPRITGTNPVPGGVALTQGDQHQLNRLNAKLRSPRRRFDPVSIRDSADRSSAAHCSGKYRRPNAPQL